MDYCIWDELNKAISWSRVKYKSMLINELKLAVERIGYNVTRDSVEDLRKRMYKILHTDASFLR